MIHIDQLKNSVLAIFQTAATRQGATLYLFGDIAMYYVTKQVQFLKNNVVNLAISGSYFNTQEFYDEISKSITINKELENTPNKYVFLCSGYIFEINLTGLPDSRFNIDGVFINLSDNAVVDASSGLKSLQSDVVTIRSLKNPRDWDISDILGFVIRFASFNNSEIELNNISDIKSRNINSYKLNNHDVQERLLDLLLSYRPGTGIRFLINTIPGGKEWVFNQLIDFVIKHNIPLNEDVGIQSIFTKDRFDLLDLYNEFFLSERTSAEFPKERTNRLVTTLRLLFDTPTLNLSETYIDKVSIFSSALESTESKVSLFADEGCGYGPCPECNPLDCSPQCCCCHSVDIVSAATMRCHKRVVLSCNEDGTGHEPGETFVNCENCVTACQTILGLRPDLEGEGCHNFTTIGQSEGWWTIPSGNWPCDCDCATESSGSCILTCVTCRDLFCTSVATVTGNDCNYNITMVPGDDCCGTQPIEEIVFVVHAKQPATNGGEATVTLDLKALTTEIVNRIDSVNSTVNYALVTFDDTHVDADANGARYVTQFTNAADFISQIPDTIVQGDLQDTPFPSVWYAAVRAVSETVWTPSSRRRVIVVGGRDNYQFDVEPAPAVCEGYVPDRGLGECFNAFMAISLERQIRFGLATWNAGLPFDSRQLDIIEDEINGAGQCGTAYSLDLNTGEFFFGDTDFYSCVEEFTGFSSSCDCVNSTPIPIRQDIPSCKCCRDGVTDPCIDDPFDIDCIASLPESCFDIPIIKCLPGEECDCTLPTALNVCGNTVLIEPARQNLICCSELGFGCECEADSGPNAVECCGTQCHDICSMYRQNPDIEEIIDFVWTDCWTKKAGVDQASTPNCSDSCCPDPSDPEDDDYPCELREPGSTDPCCPCLLENQNDCCNCCIRFLDENSQPTIIYCRPDIAQQVRDAVSGCSVSPPPPPPWDPPNASCRTDKCIVGEPVITDEKSIDDQCENKYAGCTVVRHPSTVVLNNGIGLVAYESQEDVSVIKIQQFNTSLGNKLLPNREFNLGRLENQTRWTDSIAKLYVYDPLPQHLLSGTGSPSDESTWKDAIAFKNGPLEKQFFPLAIPPYDSDANGTFIRFYVGSNALTNPFPSPDDVYDVKFFVFDFEDEGVIGDSTDTTTTGAEFSIENRRVVDEALLLSAHIHDGRKVPVAYPSITVATNYSEPLENSHFVYLTYQALEDNKWNVYLRQLRLSEYERQEQIDEAINDNLISTLSSLNIGEVIYRAVCVGDSCSVIGDSYSIKRTVVFEVLTTDGRDVLNPSLTGNWPSLCPGHNASEFPKEKVFVQFVHSAAADRCPDSEDFNDIFFNWYVGQEFLVPVANITAQGLFSILQISDDDSISTGIFSPPISAGGAIISSSAVGAVWYNSSNDSEWSVMTGQSYDTLRTFKGMDIGEPILLTANESGHSIRPIVKINYNNDIFVVYETTESGLSQLKIVGTATPTNNLPSGVFRPKDIDSTLRYFLTSTDFIYQNYITMPTEGLNQMADMFIDFNDVIHLAWQSNRDKRWEIYYANSEDQFRPKRITDHAGKSLNPSIDGDNTGRIFIVWHDDRFGTGYEVLMAYYPGTRITPLSQQDPYLAGMRNSGYTHYVDEVSFLLKNSTNSSICISNVIVDFYKDRTLTQLAFSIEQDDYPFAFNIIGSENDYFTQTFDEFSVNWTEDPYEITLTSVEFDTGLNSSIITQFVLNFDSFDPTSPPIEISFRGSNIADDPLSDVQWSAWLPITYSGAYYYATFGQENITGRYKQVRLKFNYLSTQPVMQYLSVTSESLHRICLAPGQQTTGVLDLTPELRIDNLGAETAEFPIPVNIESNLTYFIRVRGKDDSGGSVSMENQFASVSCESCINQISTWNFESCSLKSKVTNSNAETGFYNFKITFYLDQERNRKINEFLLFPDSNDLAFVTVNTEDAISKWTSRGLQIPSGASETIVFWPELSPTSGLICGVGYYVDIEYCSTLDSGNSTCSEANLQILENIHWFCNCKSRRWDPEFEDAPVNILEAKRWASSGDGFSDTRLTETINTNNLNPIIKIRSNQNGVIIYQTNRTEPGETQDDKLYRVYTSVFSVVPTSEMFASGAQSIISPFGAIIHRSDVPICENSDPTRIGCYDENNQRMNQTIRGENISFSLDQYDNLFLAAEVPFKETGDSIKCREFTKDKQRYILVHTCGSEALDLFDTPSSTLCASEKLLGKTFFENDSVSRNTKVLVRVANDYVAYHITKNNIAMPVVNKCDIKLEIIGATETIAIRLKNGNEKEFSAWIPLSLETGSNSTTVNWRLDQGSGIRLVEFQCATPAGVSQSGILNVVADYVKVTYNIKLYKPLVDMPFPPESADITSDAIWVESNKLPLYDGKSVAALRRPFSSDNTIIYPIADYVFVEIVPDALYMQQFSGISDETKSSGNSGIEPTFDFLHQGEQDSFGISTKWARNEQGVEVFRGVITLNKDNTSAFKDGLASILPHFKNDCSDIAIGNTNQIQENYIKDTYNVIVEGIPTEIENEAPKDVFSKNRDDLGNVLHKITIRPNEDPYFVFGDPNYRIPNE